MSHVRPENRGTGLGDVFDILLKAPSERLISLTLQLGESPEDNIIHALCLIILQREAQALTKLQMLGDNSLAKHLAEKWPASGGKFEDFEVQCGHFQAQTAESLSALARIFKVLSEQRLCEPLLRNLAYQRALSSDCLKTSNYDDLRYHQFKEEAKVACGPAEWMFFTSDHKLESSPDPNRSLGEGNVTLKVSVSQDKLLGIPSPLQESTSVPSYPTHLEISVPPTASFPGDKAAPETLQNPKVNPSILTVSQAKQASWQPRSPELQLRSTGSPLSGADTDPKMDETLAATSSKLKSHHEIPSQPNNPSIEPKSAQPSATYISLPKVPISKEIHESRDAEEEEEERFYAFVILHAPEDEDMAECMREKLEKVICSEGATFSEDFAILGKSTLRCVEDAINNSAFTFLLLTRNFNTKMLEMKTNIALINSINKKHKFNTVIPLLPRENCMPRQSVPMVLQTLVALEENKSFERKLQKSLTAAKIEKQRKIWTLEQSLRLSMEQKLHLSPGGALGQDGGDGRPWWPQQPNIHIVNSNYVMIGNDSKMTVDFGGSADKDSSVCAEEEQ
ncbi:TIR domain-containing adapter molecule 1 [Odontesthes bonariensis]|uniref:TIR domain-containing adapter molecule 1 n=1 Tax=Odontesthes bonariensis TaxID=219752 RepID=UPI003F580CBA